MPFSEHFVNGSPEAINLIEWMMQHDPDDRPTTEEAMNHPLFAVRLLGVVVVVVLLVGFGWFAWFVC